MTDAEHAKVWRDRAEQARRQAVKSDPGWAWHWRRQADRFEQFAWRYERDAAER